MAEIDKEDESSASEESGHSGLTDLPNTDQESIKESGQTDQSSNAEFDHTQKNSVDQIEHSCSESDQGMVNGTGETDEHPNKDLDQAVVSDNGHTDQSISAYGQQGVNDIDNVNSISQNEKSTRVEESGKDHFILLYKFLLIWTIILYYSLQLLLFDLMIQILIIHVLDDMIVKLMIFVHYFFARYLNY